MSSAMAIRKVKPNRVEEVIGKLAHRKLER